MASIGGVSSSNTVSSLMNSANMISGLASGLDTEGMIENLVKSYQAKITQLNQKVTKTEWKQDAYRSIIQKMVGFSSKYTSYASNTNLMSRGFFNSAVKVLTKGEFADSVSASGKTGSDISLDAVHQLAKAAQYRTQSNLTKGDVGAITADKGIDLSADAAKDMELSNLKGSLSLTYGSKTVSINFNESTDVQAMEEIRAKLAKEQGVDAEKVSDVDVLAGLINQKLADEEIVFSNGNAESADKRIKAVANPNGRIGFEELGTGKNGVYISGASGNIAEQLGLSEEDLEDAKEKKPTILDTSNIKSPSGEKGLTRKLNAFDYLTEKGATTMNISLDGSTKKIAVPGIKDGKLVDAEGNILKDKDGNELEVNADNYTSVLQDEIKKAFGDKVTVNNKATDGSLQLEFKVKNEGSELVINTDVGNALGIGNTATSYLNTNTTLGKLMSLSDDMALKDDKGEFILDDKGNKQYEFKLNGETIGKFTKDSKLSDVMSAINSNKDAGVQVAYSQSTQSFTFTAKETGADSKITFGDGLAKAMFERGDATETKGQDAVFTATINGEQKTMTRTSNSVNIDGLTINMEDTFNSKADSTTSSGYAVEDAKKSVTFQSKTDSDKVIDAIKSMVEDYNTMMSEIKSAYSTMPYQNSNGSFSSYEPLTDEDRQGMSDAAIERYEEKAKQGILFGDRNLSGLYTKMNQAFSFTNKADIDTLKDMGITIGFSISDGAQSVQIDEDKLRAMLDSDPDRVADIFTKSDGIMDRMKNQLDNYAKTTGEPKGILIQQAGSPLSSLSLMNNQGQKEIDKYNTQIDQWQSKLTSQVERYTSQFTRLEMLINQMNSQSSTLAGLMGGG